MPANISIFTGVKKLRVDLELEPDDYRMMIFAWKCQAIETRFSFTRKEFMDGCLLLGVNSINGLKEKLTSAMINQTFNQDHEDFLRMYLFAYDFTLTHYKVKIGERPFPLVIPAEVAIALWQKIYYNRQPLILERWLAFLKENPCVISRRDWLMFPTFVVDNGTDFSGYVAKDYFPPIYDEFVQREKYRLNALGCSCGSKKNVGLNK